MVTAARCLPAVLLLLAALTVCAQQLSARRYDVSDGLAHSYVGAIHQDRKGYIWFGTREGLSRFDGYRFTNYGERDGLGHMIVNAIAEDRRGRLWAGTNGGGVSRLIGDPRETASHGQTESGARRRFISFRVGAGKVTIFQSAEGLPETNPRAFFQDSRGWLWIGLRYKGVSVIKDPSAETPQFVNYSTAQGLASDTVWAIAEDDAGRIYLGTGKGLDQLDPATGRIRHFNTRDGLASDSINHCLKDRNGNIWVSTTLGLSKFNPRAERIVNRPLPIYLSRVQVAGEALPLPETGALRLDKLELPASRNNLLVEYVALSFQGEQRLRYQYKLEGIDADWSEPGEGRSVSYGRLAPGSYQFLARAINQEGALSPEPAVLQFRILPPLWRRWWFLALAATTVGLAGYALYRYRVARLLELERVRTRIATDLHDDIGAGLSRVAILSEVVKLQAGAPTVSGDQSIPLLTEIADSSRGLVESMREIVWAIDPRQDDLSSVISYVRQYASGVFEAKGINWDFQVAPELEQIKLDPERRRHLFLIFKEAIHNIARHAGCQNVTLSLTLAHRHLRGEIRDDGRGFIDWNSAGNGSSPERNSTGNGNGNGHGLENMRRRAAQVGGQVQIDSLPGQGVSIKLMIPLKKR